MKQKNYNKFKLIICIGYPKTGTTYLQNFFFNKIKDINYIGIESKKFDPDLFYLRNSIIKNSDEDFIKNLPYLKKIFKQKLKKNSINFYSDENYLSPTYFGYERTIKRLSQFLTEFKKKLTVIVFKRNQSNLILSNYKEANYIKKILNINSFNELLIKLKKNLLDKKDKFLLEQYNFKRLKRYLIKNLSKKIIFYDYKDFAMDNKKFLKNFLKEYKFKMSDKIELVKINQNVNLKSKIKTKHNLKKIASNKLMIFISKFMINILPLKIKFFLKDRILLNIFQKKKKLI